MKKNIKNQEFKITRLSPQGNNSNKPLSKASIEAYTRLGEILLGIKEDMKREGRPDKPCGLTAYDYYNH